MTEEHSVVVIGGSSGIGLELARKYAALGQNVYITSRAMARAQDAADDIRKTATGTVTPLAIDLAQPEAIAAALADIKSVDSLAIVAIERNFNTVRDFDIESAQRLVAVKLVGYMEVVHALLPKMTANASVVLFGGQAKSRPYPGSAIVTSVNGAVTSMIRTLAVELAPIRFNAVHPGIIGDSPAWADKGEALKATQQRTPGGRLATTEDVIGAVDFLFANKGVNGVNLNVDGGWILT